MNTNISFVDDLAGPLAVSGFINCFLWGVEATQAAQYFRTYKQDTLLLKATVLAAIINDSFGSIVICHDIYRWSILNFGNPLAIALPGWQSASFAMSTGVSVLICQSYLIWRFHRVSNLLLASGFMAACALAGLAYNLYAVIIVAQFKSLADAGRFSHTAQVFLSLEAATDIIISLGLVGFLWLQYRETEFHSTKSLLRRLMLLSLESGVGTTLIACLSVILLSVKKDTNYGIAVGLTLGRIYSLTLISNLNMRRAGDERARKTDESPQETYNLDSCVKLRLPKVQAGERLLRMDPEQADGVYMQMVRVTGVPDLPDSEKEISQTERSDKDSVITSV